MNAEIITRLQASFERRVVESEFHASTTKRESPLLDQRTLDRAIEAASEKGAEKAIQRLIAPL